MSIKKLPEPRKGKCPWRLIGENAVGLVYWCEDCGTVLDEDGTDERSPLQRDSDTWLCPDRGIGP